MTPQQIKKALALRGKHIKLELAQLVGVSPASIARLGRALRVSFSAKPYATNPRLVERVSHYYARYGRAATQKRFPGVNVRSIVERYGHAPRQVRWEDGQIVQAARMAGLVSMQKQAEIFARPGAAAGSIKALWSKRFGVGGAHIHGLSKHAARALLRPGYPTVATQWQTRCRRGDGAAFTREIVLWCDMEPWLLSGTPIFLRDAVRAMADFQRWLFKTPRVRRSILTMMRRTSGPTSGAEGTGR